MTDPSPLSPPSSSSSSSSSSSPSWPELAGLAARVLGDSSRHVHWRSIDVADGGVERAPSPSRRYEVRAVDGIVEVAATDVGAAAFGLHEYLKAALRRRISWDTPLPLGADRLPDAVLDGSPHDGAVYHLNFCTFSYTAAFWDWPRWEREIDWMALHGVTMPLATVGHEAVLARVYRELGVSEHDVRAFLGSPAYLAWQFMGCLDEWGAPMTDGWLHEHRTLGARIVERQRRLGMTPVMPAFVGHVPASLAGPGTTTRDWWGFTTHLLSPSDPRFEQIARLVVETQRDMFGISHLFAADPFIETVPPDDDPDYLARLAATLVRGLRAGDPAAVWVMQAWTFDYLDWWTDDRIAAFLDAIDDDAMLLLDLWGEKAPQWRRFGGFRGKPWIWCALHDFGGRSDLFGDLRGVRRELSDARDAPEPPIGIGLAMEATEQNHVVYEWMLDPAAPATSIDSWAGVYAAQRYGTDDTRAADAWRDLIATVYAAPVPRLEPTERPGSVTLRPSFDLLDVDVVRAHVENWCWYDPARLVRACRTLAQVARVQPELAEAELGHDLVTATATAMVRACDRLLFDLVSQFSDEAQLDSSSREASGAAFISALTDLDTVLGTRPELRLETWETAARSWARTPAQEPGPVDGARRLVTTWNSSDSAPLTDYAARLWQGLVGGLYLERWRAWIDVAGEARRADVAPDPAELDRRIHDVTEAFLAEPTGRGRDSVAPGGLLDIVDIVLDRYEPVLIAPMQPALDGPGAHAAEPHTPESPYHRGAAP